MNSDILEKCLNIFKTSKSDNELLAALLMVTKVTKAQECDEDSMKRIFDAIGFKFLSRLLRTGGKETPTGEISGQTFRTIAVNVISSFCSLTGVIENQEFVILLPHVAAITVQQTTEDAIIELVSDCYECLTRIVCIPGGSLVVVRSGCVPCLCQAVIHKSQYHEKGVELLVHLCTVCGSDTWNNAGNYLALLVHQLTQEMDMDQTERKFQLCSTIATLLMSAPEDELDQPEYSSWKQVIEKLLFNILKNKLGPKGRNPVLRLCSVMVELCGVKWALHPDAKFLLLLTHLACIEIRMALDTEDLDQIRSMSSLLATCYNLVEHVIEYMTAGPSLQLDSTQISQLHAAMVGAFNAVIHFLSRMADHPQCQIVMPVVIASVRVLGAWIAEETSALREEVIELLPFLIQTSWETFNQCRKQPPPVMPVVNTTKSLPADVVDPGPRESSDTVKERTDQQGTDEDNMATDEPSTSTTDQVDIPTSNEQPDAATSPVNQVDHQEPNEHPKSIISTLDTPDIDLESFSSIEVLQFIMPGFCHLSADDKSRKVMLVCDLVPLLYEYLTYQFDRFEKTGKAGLNKEPEVAVLTLCGVLLNLAVMEADLVTDNPIFGEIAKCVVRKFVVLLAKKPDNLALSYNLMVLGLMIIRHRSGSGDTSEASLEDFFRSCVHLLKKSHTSTKSDTKKGTILHYHDQWEDTSEYWLLSLQVLAVCVGQYTWLPKLVLTSKWLPFICNMLLNVKADSVPQEVQKSYGEFLEAMAKASTMAIKVLKDAGGNQLARKYKWDVLDTLLH